MQMLCRSALFLVFIIIIACSELDVNKPSSPARTLKKDAIQYSESHIDFAKWKRDATCCTAVGRSIAIAAGGTHSARCGHEIHSRGGNIVDAAVAVAFCLGVERPYSAGLGGGGFMTLHLTDKGKARDLFIDFRETAPETASRNMFLDKSGKVIPGLSQEGPLSVATPSFVAGLSEIHEKYGNLKWSDILQPAIRLARDGFPVFPSLSEKISAKKDLLMKDKELKKLFFPDGVHGLKTGDTLKQADLAQTLTTISVKRSDGFYTGNIATQMLSTLKGRAARLNRKDGFVTAKDLAYYVHSGVKRREPLMGTYKGYQLVTAPPPSAGGVVLLQSLNVLDGFEISKDMPYSKYAHLLAETLKRGFADRSVWIGDPDHWEDRTYLDLITPAHAAKLRAQIDTEKATPSDKIRPSLGAKEESGNTTQLSLIDSHGNAVSSTITINGIFGSGIMAPKTGVVLNNEMDDFSIKPGEQNLYGLTGNEANSVAPNKRPVSSMMPTIVLSGGKPILVVGAAGGSQIISAVLEVILYQLRIYQNNLKQAVFAPRIHHQWIPDTLTGEWAGIPSTTQEKLKEKGYTMGNPPFLPQLQAVAWEGTTGDLVAVFDPRDEGGAEAE